MIKIVSSDGEVFEVEVKVAQSSMLIKKILDDLGMEGTEAISIPQNAPEISGRILGKIITWANHHKDDPAAAEDDEKKVKSTTDMSNWDAKFLQVDQTTLIQMIRAANYLDMKGLLDVTCKKLARIIKGMTLEEVRQTFHIQNDFTPDEHEQIRKENSWFEGIPFGVKALTANGNVMDSVQDVDNEGDKFNENCLHNSLVAWEIFQYLSDLELVAFSLLNKMWSYEVRSFMRKRRNLIASLDCSGSCQVVKAFAADLQQMNIVPFSGIRIVLPDGHDSCQCAMYPADDVIFDPLPFKTLSVQMPEKRWSSGCPLAKKILQDVSGFLEQLTIQILLAAEFVIKDYLQEESSFPRLQTLKLEETPPFSWAHPDHVMYFKALIMSRAPKLREVHSSRPIPVLLDLVEGSSIVPVWSFEVCPPFEEISEDKFNSPVRLQRMSLVFTDRHPFNFDRFNEIAPMLLRAPCTSTLCELTVDDVLAVPLMCYGVCLENVRKFTMGIGHKIHFAEEDYILRILEDFDFTRIFPNLSKVHITSSDLEDIPKGLQDSLSILIMETNADVRESMPDRAVNINELNLHGLGFVNNYFVPLFAKMCPNIERLYVECSVGDATFMTGSICEHWVNLKELHMKSIFLEDTANFDCTFCGIFFDEVVQLMQKDDAYLKRVNIVPVEPSIACLTNLMVLNMEYDLRQRPDPVIYDTTNPMFFLSKITGLTTLARCPNLGVSLKISPDGAHAVSHLKPYVSINPYYS